ncbi:MAG: rod shape-determining protein MreD [Gemmatimonadetes bacterium]|nr:rod shape-determining protein MreD [Gemmatimonadota bacterium]
MTPARVVRGLVVFILLVTLHYGVRPLLGWRAPVDFLLIAILLSAVRMRPGAAALVGFVAGIATDSLAPEGFGSGALALTAVAYTASWLKAVFFADNLALNGIFFFLGKWGSDLVVALAERRLHGVELVSQVLLWSPLSAVVTAVSGLVLLVLLRPLLDEPAAP